MFRKFIKRINAPNRVISVFSLILSLIGVVGFVVWIQNEFRKGSISSIALSDMRFQLVTLGAIMASFILIKSIFQDIEDLFFREERMTTGMSLPDTRFSYKKILDSKCKEVIMVGQNMRTLMSDSKFRDHIVDLLRNNKDVKITFVLSTPEILRAMSKSIAPAYRHYIDSVTEMRDMYHDRLGISERNRFFVCAHAGATSLSATIRDPKEIKRAVITFTVKWATDRDPQNRIFCVVEKWENRPLFNRLYGHVDDMTRSESGSLKELCEKIGVEWLD